EGTTGDVREKAEEIELAALLQNAISKARDASSRVDLSGVGDTARAARKRAQKAISNGHAPDIDTEKATRFLDNLREKLIEALETVRDDIAPKAMDTVQGTVIPAAQEAMQNVTHRVQEDVMPAAQDAMARLREDVIPDAQ